MKKYIFTEEQLIRLATALNQVSVVGMAQAELLTICKQVLDAPDQIIDEKEGENK
jgi:hypothetical protein